MTQGQINVAVTPGVAVAQQQQQQQQQPAVPIMSNAQPVVGVPQVAQPPAAGVAPAVAGAQVNPVRERQFIWQGVLEWQEKTRDPQKLPRHVPCQVSAAVTNGETEV